MADAGVYPTRWEADDGPAVSTLVAGLCDGSSDLPAGLAVHRVS